MRREYEEREARYESKNSFTNKHFYGNKENNKDYTNPFYENNPNSSNNNREYHKYNFEQTDIRLLRLFKIFFYFSCFFAVYMVLSRFSNSKVAYYHRSHSGNESYRSFQPIKEKMVDDDPYLKAKLEK